MGKAINKIYPSPGLMVAFENSDLSYHGTEQLSGDAPDRVTLAAFFVAPIRAGATRKRALFMPNRERMAISPPTLAAIPAVNRIDRYRPRVRNLFLIVSPLQ